MDYKKSSSYRTYVQVLKKMNDMQILIVHLGTDCAQFHAISSVMSQPNHCQMTHVRMNFQSFGKFWSFTGYLQ